MTPPAHLQARQPPTTRLALRRLLQDDGSAGAVAAVERGLAALRQQGLLTPLEVYVLRSVTLEPLAPRLRALAGARAGLDLELRFGNFDQFEQEIAGRGALPADEPGAVVLAARLEELAPPLVRRFAHTAPAQRAALAAEVAGRITGWLDDLRARWPRAAILLLGFALPEGTFGLAESRTEDGQLATIRRLNATLASACRGRTGTYWLDLDHALAGPGRRAAYDRRLWAHARLPYGQAGLEALATLLWRALAALSTPRRKCVVLDCDHTLWGGILGEDGPDGIALGPEHPGSAFVAFQEALLELHGRGVLLALCSKNDEAQVLEVLDHHPCQVLRRAHLAAWRINWRDKASNLAELAHALDLGLDALIFVDNSPFECELVRQQLPQVEVVEAPADPLRLEPLVADLDSLDSLVWTDEDAARGDMYRAQAERGRLQAASASLEDYLRSLEMRLWIAPTGTAEIARVGQLTRKTNQFNLTTRRYSDQEIRLLLADPEVEVVHARLADRFGDYGLTAVVILRREAHQLRIDSLLLSCRIIGRGVEDALLSWLVRRAAAAGVQTVLGEYIATSRNGQTRDFYRRFGFDDLGEGRFAWPIGRALPAAPDWIALQPSEDVAP